MDKSSERDESQSPRLLFRLVIPYKTPTLNFLFKLNHWQRMKHRRHCQDVFMSALRAAAKDSPTLKVYVENMSSTLSDMRK